MRNIHYSRSTRFGIKKARQQHTKTRKKKKHTIRRNAKEIFLETMTQFNYTWIEQRNTWRQLVHRFGRAHSTITGNILPFCDVILLQSVNFHLNKIWRENKQLTTEKKHLKLCIKHICIQHRNMERVRERETHIHSNGIEWIYGNWLQH